jgi:hypothetical protein
MPGSGKTCVQLMVALDKAARPPKTMNTWIDEAKKFNIYNVDPSLSKLIIYHSSFPKHVKYISTKTLCDSGCVLVSTPHYMNNHDMKNRDMKNRDFTATVNVKAIKPKFGNLYTLVILKSFDIPTSLRKPDLTSLIPRGKQHCLITTGNPSDKQKPISFIFDESHLQGKLISLCDGSGYYPAAGYYTYPIRVEPPPPKFVHTLSNIKLYF